MNRPTHWVSAKVPVEIVDFQQPQAFANANEPQKAHNALGLTNAETLMTTPFPPVSWAIDGFLPEGFSVLGGRQKLGKTWMALDWSIAVATGGMAMSAMMVEQGDVLYVDLENGSRRMQDRIAAMFVDETERPDLSRLTLASNAIALNKGFLDAVDAWRSSVERPKLVVIDVLQRIKPTVSRAQNAYERDYAVYGDLQCWAMEHGLAVVGLHHTRKGGADDPLEALSGSNGLSAVADTTFLLDRDAHGTTLYCRGRDIPEAKSSVSFESARWTLSGDVPNVHLSQERQAILQALKDAERPLSPTEIAEITGQDNGNVRQALSRMARKGDVMKLGHGLYASHSKD